MSTQCVSQLQWERQKPWASDKIHINSLQSLTNAGYDCWGRPRVQPVEISVQIGLQGTVSSAAAGDEVNDSTVHYGNLSKAIIDKIPQEDEPWQLPDAFAQWIAIAVRDFASNSSIPEFIEIETYFPKSSLVGDGSSLILSHSPKLDTTSVVFHLCNLRVPALVGVNSHERTARQSIIINLWIDRLKPHMSNECYRVEQLITKTVEESSFETLESLCESIAAKVIKYFIIAKQPLAPATEPAGVRVKIEKPNAIVMAVAPAVEIYRCAEADDAFGKRMFAELGNKRPQIPFPLQGRLDEFLQAWKQD